MAEEPLPQDGSLHSSPCIRRHRGKAGSSPPPSPYHSGGSRSISKGMWHALVAGSSSTGTAASKPLVLVLLSWVLPQRRRRREMDSWVPMHHGLTLTRSGFILLTGVVKFTLKQFLSEKWRVATTATLKPVWNNCYLETCLKTREEPLPALPLLTLPARNKCKEPEPRELCLDDLTFQKAQVLVLSLEAGT